MDWSSDFEKTFEEWFSKGPFAFGRRLFADMERFERMFEDMRKAVPRDLVREVRRPDGSIVREMGPMIYGYSMTVGPDGKPVIREFGNVKPSLKPGIFGIPKRELEFQEKREPLVDTAEDEKTVKVVVELPGVEKHDINLHATENSLTVDVDVENRKFHKEIELPAKVDPTSTEASHRNGILTVTLKKTGPTTPKGTAIKVD
ncbi:MAG: archaeal heat shock protein Hsp20 [Candidatus Bathyarchaeia archaeon]